MFFAANKRTRDRAGASFATGIFFDTIIDIREHGMFFELNEGNPWIFTIENKTAEALTPRVEPFDIPKGAYLSFIPVNNRFDPPFIKKSGR